MPEQLTAEHISRIIELRDHLIEMGPDRFEMQSWFTIQDDADACNTFGWDELIVNTDRAADLLQSGQKCGTAACIAGHAVLLWPELISYDHIGAHLETDEVATYLGMQVGAPNDFLLDRWFSTMSWPDRYRVPYNNLVNQLHHRLAQLRGDEDASWKAEQDHTFILRAHQHATVLAVMDDLIHGRLFNWHDDDTSAVDRADAIDAQEV